MSTGTMLPKLTINWRGLMQPRTEFMRTPQSLALSSKNMSLPGDFTTLDSTSAGRMI